METYKIMNFGSSELIRDKLTPASPHSKFLTVPLFRRASCRSFSFYASRLWNTLPMEIGIRAMPKTGISEKSEQNLSTFKKDIKRWILDGGVPFR